MRLFVAAWPDEGTRAALASLPLRPTGGMRPVEPAMWHVTLRFLGQVEPGLVPDLQAALDRAAATAARTRARVGPAVSWFGRGRVLQVPVTGLEGLAGAVRAATEPFVPVGEGEPAFTGHLTLARIGRRGGPHAAARAALAGHAVAVEFAVDAVDLVVSEPLPGGHRYRTLATFLLGAIEG